MTLGQSMRVSSTGLHAERFRMDTISGNIANANSMTTEFGEAYRRKLVVLAGDQNGVRVVQQLPDQRPLRQVYEPDNPNANAEGFVTYSNVDPVAEMVDMIGATRAYEANINAFNAAKSMLQSALRIGQIA